MTKTRRFGENPYVYLIPTGLFTLLVVAYPVALLFRTALFHEVLTRPWEGVSFVGLENFVTLFQTEAFWSSLTKTVNWTVGSVIVKTVIGLTLALLLNQNFKGRGIYRTLVLIPWVTPQVVSAIVWRWMYSGEYGMLNAVLLNLGILDEKVSWLGQRTTAFLGALANDVWLGIPFMAIILLAGLQSIPGALYEAASVDGAGRLRSFFSITLPSIRPVMLTATILSTVWTFNSFNVIWVLTRGGPVDATEILVIRTFKEAFGKFDMGIGSALAVITFLFLMVFSILYWGIFNREEERA